MATKATEKALERLENSVKAKAQTRKQYRKQFNAIAGRWRETLPDSMPALPSLDDDNNIVSDIARFYKANLKFGRVFIDRSKDLFLYGFQLAREFGLQDVAEDIVKQAGLSKSDVDRFGAWANCPAPMVERVALGELSRNRLTVLLSAKKQIIERHPDVTGVVFWEWFGNLDNPADYKTSTALRNRYLETRPVSKEKEKEIKEAKDLETVNRLAKDVLTGNTSIAELSDKFTSKTGKVNPLLHRVKDRVASIASQHVPSVTDTRLVIAQNGLTSSALSDVDKAIAACEGVLSDLVARKASLEHEVQNAKIDELAKLTGLDAGTIRKMQAEKEKTQA